AAVLNEGSAVKLTLFRLRRQLLPPPFKREHISRNPLRFAVLGLFSFTPSIAAVTFFVPQLL
ncbi:MAG: hypothetical protein MJY71_07950, partial [Bacteroidaceae bacterium]|nr:hypothetical protein [Bacteroidaceae bacterium]